MAAKEIKTVDDLRAWLKDKPVAFAQAIALRAALRALPYIVVSDESWLRSFALLPFGALATSWIQLADEPTFSRSEAARANARFGGEAFDFVSYKKYPIARNAADASYHCADAQSRSGHVYSDCIEGVGKAAQAFLHVSGSEGLIGSLGDFAVGEFWRSVELDANFFSDYDDSVFSILLKANPLWDAIPINWGKKWRVKLREQLEFIDPNYAVWIDWYERRIRGARAAFDIPGDKHRTEDKAILRRLAEATDEDFWGKGHEYVNATLKGWLDEARERAAKNLPPPEPISDISAVPTLPAQNTSALSFRTDEQGRIAIDASANSGQLRSDAGAQERHSEALSEARALLDRCLRSNAAARLTRLLGNYVLAAGETLSETSPSLLVQRGERLRQELAAYANPDSFLDPLADDLLLDFKGWESAHNMLVGLDPVLNAADRAMLGPDRQPLLIPPAEIRQKVHEADEADILADGVMEVLEETAMLAPDVPDPNDRHTVLSTEMLRNLVIEAFALVLNNGFVASTAVGGLVAVGSSAFAGAVTFSSSMSAIRAAEYLVTYRKWFEERLDTTPTWQALFVAVADRLEKMTPFKPKQD